MRLIDADNLKIPNDAPYKASVKRVVAMQPTVEAREVVHGKWILGDVKPGYLTPGGNSPWICSECGEIVSWWLGTPTENFCSNCGADMRGEQCE